MITKELIKKIENVFNIEFKEWQQKYLLDEPMILDLNITGRCTGKTLVYIIKLLYSSDEPLDLRRKENIVEISDWWSIGKSKEDACRYGYWNFFKQELKIIYSELNDAGLKTRVIILN